MKPKTLLNFAGENEIVSDAIPVERLVFNKHSAAPAALDLRSNGPDPRQQMTTWNIVGGNRRNRRAERALGRRETFLTSYEDVVIPSSSVIGRLSMQDSMRTLEAGTKLDAYRLCDFRRLLIPEAGRISTPAWKSIVELVEAWSALTEGWDGEEASAISTNVINSVLAFIREAEKHDLSKPRPYLASDGEIGFHWDGKFKATVAFLAADRFLAFCPRVDQEPLRVSGPLDISNCSKSLFKALKAYR